MKGSTAFEKLTGISNQYIEEAAEFSLPEKRSEGSIRKEKFSRFISSGWGVAMICCLVAAAVLTGIIAAGRSVWPVKPPISSDSQTETQNLETEQEPLLPNGCYITASHPDLDHHVSLAPWLTSATDIGFGFEQAIYADPALVGTTKTTPFGVFTYFETVGYSEELIAQGAIDNRVDRYQNENATIGYTRADGLLAYYFLRTYDGIPDLTTPLTEAEVTEMAQTFLKEHVPADILNALTPYPPTYIKSESHITGYDLYTYYFRSIHSEYRGEGDISIDICPTKGVIKKFDVRGAFTSVLPMISLTSTQEDIYAIEKEVWERLKGLGLNGFSQYDQPYLRVNAYGEVYLHLQFVAYDNDPSNDLDWMTKSPNTEAADEKYTDIHFNISYDTRRQYSVYIKIS